MAEENDQSYCPLPTTTAHWFSLSRQRVRFIFGDDKDGIQPRDFKQAFHARLQVGQKNAPADLADLL